ncbi:MAG: insulinase family protein [Chitinophagaceae bacterium]|nr:insulinase family protein [Chitinophagaceae bacterium]
MLRIKFLLSLVLLLGTGRLSAQNPNWIQKTSNGYSYKMVRNDSSKTRFYTLQNGLTVILSVNPETPRIQTIIATKAGSKTDPATNTGLAHYLEHMLFKGTDRFGSLDWSKEKPLLDEIERTYSMYNQQSNENRRTYLYKRIDSLSGAAARYAIANEYDKMMAMIGAQGTNAFTSFEQTAYINDIPANQVDNWLMVEAERFRNPVLRIFHTELEAVYEEKNRSLDSDDDKVFELLFSKLFQKHNYGLQTTIGTIEHLKNPSLVEIRNYFKKNYVPNNMVLIMAGDLNPDEVIKKIDDAFSYMQPNEVPPYTFTPEEPITKPILGEVFGPDAEYVDIAFRFPGADSKEAMLLNLMSNILSNGNAGLMDLNLVKKQLVLEASAGAYTLKDYSVLFLEGKAKEGQTLEEVRKHMLEQIELLKDGRFDEEMLKAIINNYKKSQMQRLESNAGRAYSLLEAFTSEVSWEKYVMEIEAMSRLTKKDIQAFCQKWLSNNYVCIYKRLGKDSKIQKIDKPTITPVEVNRDAQSDFVKTLAARPVKPIQPVFVNYDKDIVRTPLKGQQNTTEILSVKNKTNQLFTQYYYVETGALFDRRLPIALEYLQYLGTDKFSAENISKRFYTLACDFGVNASDEESYVYLNALQENYQEAVALFEHLLAECNPDQQALNEMIAGIKKKRSDSKLNKNYIRSGLRYYAQYGARNPFNNELSNAELDQLKAEELVELLHQLTSYKHIVLYYGPENPQKIAAQLSTLHPLPAAYLKNKPTTPYTTCTQNKNEVLMADYDMVQAEIQWFRNDKPFNANEVPLINLFNEYFGGNMSGIVFQEIRESKALAYSTYAAFNTPAQKEYPFSMGAYVGCQADKMKEAIAGMEQLLNQLPVSEKLFEQSRKSILNTISTTRTTKTGILFSYLSAKKRGLHADLNQATYQSVSGFKFADIQRFHQDRIANKPYTMLVLGSPEKLNMDVLQKHGAIKKISLEELFGY